MGDTWQTGATGAVPGRDTKSYGGAGAILLARHNSRGGGELAPPMRPGEGVGLLHADVTKRDKPITLGHVGRVRTSI